MGKPVTDWCRHWTSPHSCIRLIKKSFVHPLISKATTAIANISPHNWPPSPGLRRLSYPSNSLSRMRVKMVMLSLLSSTTSETCFWESLAHGGKKRGKKSEKETALNSYWKWREVGLCSSLRCSGSWTAGWDMLIDKMMCLQDSPLDINLPLASATAAFTMEAETSPPRCPLPTFPSSGPAAPWVGALFFQAPFPGIPHLP